MRLASLSNRLREFLFPADDGTWLSVLRIGLGFQIILYCLSLRRDWDLLLTAGSDGLISRELTEAMLTLQSPLIPRLGWLVRLGSYIGCDEETVLRFAWFGLLAAGTLLLIGLFCRSSAVVAWLLHLCAVKSGDFLAYGMDNFTTIGLFYLMIAPLPDRFALDRKLWKTKEPDPHFLGFHRRVLQVQLCFIYFFGGLTKALGAGWWTGASLWRALTRPPFDIVTPDVLISWGSALPVLGVAVWAIEIGYVFLIWPGRTRSIWLVCILAMHLVIGGLMGLYLFSLIMIILNVAAFGPGSRFAWRKNSEAIA